MALPCAREHQAGTSLRRMAIRRTRGHVGYCMKLLIDMNLSPSWVRSFSHLSLQSSELWTLMAFLHWRFDGPHRANCGPPWYMINCGHSSSICASADRSRLTIFMSKAHLVSFSYSMLRSSIPRKDWVRSIVDLTRYSRDE